MSAATELLKAHTQLQGFADAMIEPIAAAGQVKSYAAGDPVFQVGMPNDGLYFLISGEVRVFLMNEHGEQDFGPLGAGEILGDLALLAPDKHLANVTATKRSIVVFLPLTALEALKKEKPGVFSQLAMRTSRRFALAARGLGAEALFS